MRQDYVEAYKWFQLAARTPTGARSEMSARYRLLCAAQMTTSQIAEAQRLAKEWQEKHPVTPAPVFFGIDSR